MLWLPGDEDISAEHEAVLKLWIVRSLLMIVIAVLLFLVGFSMRATSMPLCTARAYGAHGEFTKPGIIQVTMTIRPATDCFSRCTGLVRYRLTYSSVGGKTTISGLADFFSRAGEDAEVSSKRFVQDCFEQRCTVDGVDVMDVSCLGDRS